MPIALWIAFVLGLLGFAAGLLDYASLRPQLPHAPAVVLVPQMIQAVLISGFGALMATLAAAALALLTQGERHAEALTRIARATEPQSTAPSIRGPMPRA